uniref:Uncharacterized protein n=1 Tax=Oryza rufipogon TaxID=4529 RepID=A0A0E0PIV7_ORYRU
MPNGIVETGIRARLRIAAVVARTRLLMNWLFIAGLYHGREFYPTADIKDIDSSNDEDKSDDVAAREDMKLAIITTVGGINYINI